jgi:uncharacterized protein (DUF1330 family)
LPGVAGALAKAADASMPQLPQRESGISRHPKLQAYNRRQERQGFATQSGVDRTYRGHHETNDNDPKRTVGHFELLAWSNRFLIRTGVYSFIVMELQMPAYYIGEHIVSDFTLFDAYLVKAVPMIERFGGRYLTKAGTHEILEGDWKPNRVVVIEFPDIASIRNWYQSPEYQPLIALRRSAAIDVMIMLEGL